MKITVIGMGYVGLSNALLLGQKHSIVCNDIDKSKLESLDKRISPIKDPLISKYLKNKNLKLTTSNKIDYSIANSDYIIISTPTNYNIKKNSFDTSSIDQTLKKLHNLKSNSCIVIKSTIPIGYVERLNKKYKKLRIYFSPEFLREGHALYDNLHPSRIVIGKKDSFSKNFVNMFKKCCIKKKIETLFMSSTEAECVKLFANNYLATRVAFFNELDSFAIKNDIDSKAIIDGLSLDPRIGAGYNNPSFGYGGYCLPKDTKQLSYSLQTIPSALIKSLTSANNLRKKLIIEDILKFNVKNIGIFELAMKKNSDNFRESSIIDIIKQLKKHGKSIYIYEPLISDKETIFGSKIINNFKLFEKKVSLIVTNRFSNKLKNSSRKIYTRDIYGEN